MVEAECESERNRHIPFFHRIDTYADTMIVFVLGLGGVPLGEKLEVDRCVPVCPPVVLLSIRTGSERFDAATSPSPLWFT